MKEGNIGRLVSALPMANLWNFPEKLPDANRVPRAPSSSTQSNQHSGPKNLSLTSQGQNNATYFGVIHGLCPLPFREALMAQLAKATREVNAGDNARGLGSWRVKHGANKRVDSKFLHPDFQSLCISYFLCI